MNKFKICSLANLINGTNILLDIEVYWYRVILIDKAIYIKFLW